MSDMNLGNYTAAGYGEAHSLKAEQGRLASLRGEYMNPTDKTHKEMKEVAQQFESIFLKQLLDEMEKTIDREDSLLGGGSAEGYFRDMMYDNVAQAMSTRVGGSGLGIAEMVYRQMSQQLNSEVKE